MPVWGGIEAGGTKVVCALASQPPDGGDHPPALIQEAVIPTTQPDETFGQIIEFFRPYVTDLVAIGIGSFGPVDVNARSSTYGYILDTPKPHWSHVDFVGTLKQSLQVPIGFDTDVNAAALGEHRWGHGQDLDTFLYLTIGTGIGGGGLFNGNLMHGLLHPEMGHMLLPHDLNRDPFVGACPFHQDCLEGLASGVAIEQRWQQKADTLPPNHPAWELEAHYLAMGLANLILICSPQRLILGGGVMEQSQLFPMIHSKVQAQLKSYLKKPEILDRIEDYIVPPKLGKRAGILGSLVLAQKEIP